MKPTPETLHRWWKQARANSAEFATQATIATRIAQLEGCDYIVTEEDMRNAWCDDSVTCDK